MINLELTLKLARIIDKLREDGWFLNLKEDQTIESVIDKHSGDEIEFDNNNEFIQWAFLMPYEV